MSAQAKAKAKGGLSLSFDLKSLGRGGSRLPPKPILNLAPAEAKRQVKMTYIAVILLSIVGLAAFYKFMIMDKRDDLAREQQTVAQLRQQLAQQQARLEELGQSGMESEYYHLTYDGMTEAELSLVDRVEVIEMLERVMIGDNYTRSWSLSRNQLSISLDTVTLEEVNQTVQRFLAEDIVLYCTVTTAAGSETEDAGQTSDYVTASIVVYLQIPVEEEEEESEGLGIFIVGDAPAEGGGTE